MKRHRDSEIESKLKLADELLAKRQNQAQISKALGVSIMTLHRWRKRRDSAIDSRPTESQVGTSVVTRDNGSHPNSRSRDVEKNVSIEHLILENKRLKKIVTDLLLEKMRLEELNEARDARSPGADSNIVLE